MKINLLIIFLLIFFSTNCFAMKGVVLTLETPLFETPDIRAKISQYVRKGSVIYIHASHNHDDPNRKNYFREDDSLADFTFNSDSSDFYHTLDRRGMDAYIIKQHVKLIYEDEREFTQPISPFVYDPTDYRIEEPLPEKYPFLEKSKRRATLAFLMNTPTAASYNYPATILSEQFGMRFGLNMSLTRRADWDLKDRLYFGLNFYMSSQLNSFYLSSIVNSQEIIKEIGIGPLISYDLYRFVEYKISAQWGIIPIAIFHSIEQVNQSGDSVAASFVAFNLKNKLLLTIEKHKFLPDTSLIFSFELANKLPHTIRAQNQNTTFWNQSNDSFHYPFEIEIGSLIGIQTYF